MRRVSVSGYLGNLYLPANGIALDSSAMQHRRQTKPDAIRMVAIINVPNPAVRPEHQVK
jgi:hypothetical protein